MSFDVTKARELADWHLEYPDELDRKTHRLAMSTRAACNEIERLRALDAAARAWLKAEDDYSARDDEPDVFIANGLIAKCDKTRESYRRLVEGEK